MTKESNENFYMNLPLLRRIDKPNGQKYKVFPIIIREIPRHYHDTVEFLLILKGSIDIKISFHEFTLNAGDFLLINPFEMHSLYPHSDDTLMMALHIDNQIFSNSIFIFDPYYYSSFDKEIIDEMKTLMIGTYLKSMDKEDPGAEIDFISNIADTYFVLQRYNSAEKKLNPISQTGAKNERISNLFEYMYFNYINKLRLSEFANNEHIDQSYASRIIKDGAGESFQDSISIIRVDRAEVYLLGTDYPIQEIYEDLGFSSYDYFNRQFKEYYGMTPSAYRKKYKPLSYPQTEIKYIIPELSKRKLKEILDDLGIDIKGKFSIDTKEMLLENIDYLMRFIENQKLDELEDIKISKTEKVFELVIKDNDRVYKIKIDTE